MPAQDPYAIRCEAERLISEDRVPADVLAAIVRDYGDSLPDGCTGAYDPVTGDIEHNGDTCPVHEEA